jgi:hypothetical protein
MLSWLFDTWDTAKHWQAPLPNKAKYHEGDVLDPIHSATPRSCFLMLVDEADDAGCYMWLALLAAQSDASIAIRMFLAATKVESHHVRTH